VVPDLRWPSGAFGHITGLSITNFEVIQTTGANEGPRSPGAPVAGAGPDQTVTRGTVVNLAGSVQYTNAAPLVTQWRAYSGPGTVTFGNTNQSNTTAMFSAPGQYTLMLKADDGIHSPAYDAAVITVQDTIQMNIQRAGSNIVLGWAGGTAPFQLERTPLLPATQWVFVGAFSTNTAIIPRTSNAMFFRVREQ
jgi:hypothetical protein